MCAHSSWQQLEGPGPFIHLSATLQGLAHHSSSLVFAFMRQYLLPACHGHPDCMWCCVWETEVMCVSVLLGAWGQWQCMRNCHSHSFQGMPASAEARMPHFDQHNSWPLCSPWWNIEIPCGVYKAILKLGHLSGNTACVLWYSIQQ